LYRPITTAVTNLQKALLIVPCRKTFNFIMDNMRKTFLLSLCTLLCCTTAVFSQEKKFASFDAEQKKYAQEIQAFLRAKRNDFQNKNIFSDLQSNKAVAINPLGEVHDSSGYRGVPQPLGDQVNIDSLPKDKLYTISIKPDSASQKAVVYNEGKTLVYSWKALVTMYAFGHLIKYNVARLETYIQHKGRWMMVAGSGTEVNPKWRPTPLAR
jgi:hypothetical protein